MTDSATRTQPAARGSWFMTFGIALLVAGFVAIIFPLFASIAFKFVIGWVLLLIGAAYIAHALVVSGWTGQLMNILLGIMFVITGGWLVFDPYAGLIALTVLLAMSFVAQGFIEAAAAWRMRPMRGWGWLMFSGIVALVAGVMIFQGLPSSAGWALGLLAGINLISSGMFFLALGTAVRES